MTTTTYCHERGEEHDFDTVRGRMNAARHCTKCQCISLDWDDVDDEYIASCPACGQPIDYCQGHGEIGDPDGALILSAHDDGNHAWCHPDGCEDAAPIA